MASKPKTIRNAEQRVRQRAIRDAARQTLRPTRDDIARMLLWQTIRGVIDKRTDSQTVLGRLRNEVVAGLEGQGFDARESEDVFEDLVSKYAEGPMPFRLKRHLVRRDGGEASDG